MPHLSTQVVSIQSVAYTGGGASSGDIGRVSVSRSDVSRDGIGRGSVSRGDVGGRGVNVEV